MGNTDSDLARTDLLLGCISGRELCLVLTVSYLVAYGTPACKAEETNATVRHSPYIRLNTTGESKARAKELERKRRPRLSNAELEKHLFDLINRDRAKLNAPPVKLSPLLSKLARQLADDLLEHDSFGHTTSDGLGTQQRASRMGITAPVFENVGSESGPDAPVQMVESLEKSFLDEPPGKPNHRFILLKHDQTSVGVGVASSKDNVVIVEDFTQSDPDRKGAKE